VAEEAGWTRLSQNRDQDLFKDSAAWNLSVLGMWEILSYLGWPASFLAL